MWTKARSPPPLGTTKPNPFSSFQSVIRPARRIGVPIEVSRDVPVPGGPRSVPEPALIANCVRSRSSPPRRLALDPADGDQDSAGDANGDAKVRRWKVRADLKPQPDTQCNVGAEHHPALPRAGQAPAPAMGLCGEPIRLVAHLASLISLNTASIKAPALNQGECARSRACGWTGHAGSRSHMQDLLALLLREGAERKRHRTFPKLNKKPGRVGVDRLDPRPGHETRTALRTSADALAVQHEITTAYARCLPDEACRAGQQQGQVRGDASCPAKVTQRRVSVEGMRGDEAQVLDQPVAD